MGRGAVCAYVGRDRVVALVVVVYDRIRGIGGGGGRGKEYVGGEVVVVCGLEVRGLNWRVTT